MDVTIMIVTYKVIIPPRNIIDSSKHAFFIGLLCLPLLLIVEQPNLSSILLLLLAITVLLLPPPLPAAALALFSSAFPYLVKDVNPSDLNIPLPS